MLGILRRPVSQAICLRTVKSVVGGECRITLKPIIETRSDDLLSIGERRRVRNMTRCRSRRLSGRELELRMLERRSARVESESWSIRWLLWRQEVDMLIRGLLDQGRLLTEAQKTGSSAGVETQPRLFILIR